MSTAGVQSHEPSVFTHEPCVLTHIRLAVKFEDAPVIRLSETLTLICKLLLTAGLGKYSRIKSTTLILQTVKLVMSFSLVIRCGIAC